MIHRDRPAEFDLVAIGCGPFNMSVAALASTLPDLSFCAFEATDELRWHPGLMFDDSLFQQSFLADLVSLVDPVHPLSFLSYLKAQDRLYPFFVREQFHPTRREYEAYLQWVASRLRSVVYGTRVNSVCWEAGSSRFVLVLEDKGRGVHRVSARHVVVGVGTEPHLTDALQGIGHPCVLHSAQYMERRRDVLRAPHVTVVGSGQSAAEVVLDLLRENLQGGPALSWLTRTESFAPLDYSKLVLEMTTPAYVRYFHGLGEAVRDRLNAQQWRHYRGISGYTLDQIHDALYQRELLPGLRPVELRCAVEAISARLRRDGRISVSLEQRDTKRQFEHSTDLIIAATGYRNRAAACLAPLSEYIVLDSKGRMVVDLDYRVALAPAITGKLFVANAELHTHGVATPDLGVSAYRSATILNSVLGREAYSLPRRTAFSSFGVPGDASTGEAAGRVTPEITQGGRA
ncbi:MAG: hypothetical protein RL385_6069 [Pseudomonadota bacterium]|jgi:lysine N6-hydroxylase